MGTTRIIKNRFLYKKKLILSNIAVYLILIINSNITFI